MTTCVLPGAESPVGLPATSRMDCLSHPSPYTEPTAAQKIKWTRSSNPAMRDPWNNRFANEIAIVEPGCSAVLIFPIYT